MNNKTVTLTAVERSYLIIELQKKLNETMIKYEKESKAKCVTRYYMLEDACFFAKLLDKIKGEDE